MWHLDARDANGPRAMSSRMVQTTVGRSAMTAQADQHVFNLHRTLRQSSPPSSLSQTELRGETAEKERRNRKIEKKWSEEKRERGRKGGRRQRVRASAPRPGRCASGGGGLNKAGPRECSAHGGDPVHAPTCHRLCVRVCVNAACGSRFRPRPSCPPTAGTATEWRSCWPHTCARSRSPGRSPKPCRAFGQCRRCGLGGERRTQSHTQAQQSELRGRTQSMRARAEATFDRRHSGRPRPEQFCALGCHELSFRVCASSISFLILCLCLRCSHPCEWLSY